MKILVIGGSGVIGSQLVKKLEKYNDLYWTFYKNKSDKKNSFYLDITKKEQVIKEISKINPEIIFHTTAITNVDLCEENMELAESVNYFGTYNIIEACKNTKSKIVYISTSAVFDGTKNEYSEDDEPSTCNNYGKTKLKGEKIVMESNLSYLILRIDHPFDWNQKWQHTNSVLRVINTISKKKKLKEIIDWYNSPTYIPDIIDAITKLIENDKNGIYHLIGNDFLNRYEFAQIIVKIFGLDDKMLIPINSESLQLSAKRSNSKLSNKKLFNETGMKMKGVEEGLENMKINKSNF